MRLIFLLVLCLLFTGCARSPATLAGGKPVDYWLEQLRAPSPQARREAVFKLGNVGESDSRAFPALIAAIADEDALVRSEIVLALMKFPNRRQETETELRRLHEQDPDPKVRGYASRALTGPATP